MMQRLCCTKSSREKVPRLCPSRATISSSPFSRTVGNVSQQRLNHNTPPAHYLRCLLQVNREHHFGASYSITCNMCHSVLSVWPPPRRPLLDMSVCPLPAGIHLLTDSDVLWHGLITSGDTRFYHARSRKHGFEFNTPERVTRTLHGLHAMRSVLDRWRRCIGVRDASLYV